MTEPRVRIARVYDEVEAGAGVRVLVDRLWPRGIRKEDLAHDEWLKAVAPTSQLRTWYGHDAAKFEEFAERYRAELADGEQADALTRLFELSERGVVTLLTSAKQVDISHVAVLRDVVTEGGLGS